MSYLCSSMSSLSANLQNIKGLGMEISRCDAESPRLQFVIVLRVIIVHFVINLMKLVQVGCFCCLADVTVLAKSGAKVMIFIEKRDKKAEKFLSRLPFLIFL